MVRIRDRKTRILSAVMIVCTLVAAACFMVPETALAVLNNSFVINVDVTAPLPSCTVSTPLDGDSFLATSVAVSGTSSSTNGVVSSVQVSIDGGPLQLATNTGTNFDTWSFNATGLTSGAHTVYCISYNPYDSQSLPSTVVNFTTTDDVTPPADIGFVYDSTGADASFASSATLLSANWADSSDPESGITQYWVAVGSTPGGTDILNWTSAGFASSTTLTGLSLANTFTYYFSVKAENGAGLFSNVATSNGVTVDSVAPAVSISVPAPGQSVAGVLNITGSVSDSTLTQWTLTYGAGAVPSSWTQLSTGTSAVTGAQLGSWDTTLFAGYYTIKLSAWDSFNRLSETTVAIDVSNSYTVSGTIPDFQWTFIEIPGTPDSTDPIAIFGQGMYKVYRWNPEAAPDQFLSQYQYPDTVGAGYGFWVRSYDGEMSYSYTAQSPDSTQEYTLPVKTGWNQVGTPYNRAYPWAFVTIRQGTNDYDVNTAATNGIVSSTIHNYDNASNSWVQNDLSSSMQIKIGYYVRAYQDAELVFDPSIPVSRMVPRVIRPVRDYWVKISARSGDTADLENYFGASMKASLERDVQDVEEPPLTPEGEYISLYFDATDWSEFAGRYANDVRPLSRDAGNAETWYFNVETNRISETVTLTWDNTALPTDRYTFTLVNTTNGDTIDMAAQDTYTFTAEGGDISTTSFRIIVTKKTYNQVAKTHTLKPGWNLISTPVEPEITGALEQLGDDLPMLNVFQFYEGMYYPGESADIQAGIGYWIYVAANTEIDIVGLEPAPTITVPLKTGWNIIGNPYEADIPWNDQITFQYSGQELNLTQAIQQGITNGTIFTYEENAYKPATTMEPWKGYFIKISKPAEIQLKKPEEEQPAEE